MTVASATASNATHLRFVPIPAPPVRRTYTMYLYVVQLAYTLYSCQVASEKLTRTAVVERAMRLADVEGVEAVTIRRLAQELGVTAMALYWHFKNKDELLLGMADHGLLDV